MIPWLTLVCEVTLWIAHPHLTCRIGLAFCPPRMEDAHACLPAPLARVPGWLVRDVHFAHVLVDVRRMEVLQPHHDRHRRYLYRLRRPHPQDPYLVRAAMQRVRSRRRVAQD